MLSRKHEVTLLGRVGHVEAVKERGLIIRGNVEGTYTPNAEHRTHVVEQPDIILLTTKAYNTLESAKDIRNSLEPVPVVTLQNGLGNLEILERELREPGMTYAATTSAGAVLERPGILECAGTGFTRIQRPGDSHKRIFDALVKGLQCSGFSTEYVENIHMALWEKTAVNLAINYLTGLGGVKNGVVAELYKKDPYFFTSLMKEVALAAEADGVELDFDRCLNMVVEVSQNTSKNRSSMLRDLEMHRRTENEAIAGEILKRAREGDSRALPYIHCLYNLVSLKERMKDADGNE